MMTASIAAALITLLSGLRSDGTATDSWSGRTGFGIPRKEPRTFVMTEHGAVSDSTLLQTGADPRVIHLRDSLRNTLHAIKVKKEATVAFLGGSITEMTGWRDMVKDELRARFPDTKFTYIDAGISSLGSTPHAFRFGRDVLSHGTPDLLFVEAAVNDDTNEFGPREQILGMEGIMRQALAANPYMDIVMLDFIYEPFIPVLAEGRQPEVIVNHEKVAAHYGMSSVNCARDISMRMLDGTLTWKQFGGTHPAPAGHRLYTDAVMRLLDSCFMSDAVPVLKAHRCPEPLDTDCYEHASLRPIEDASNLSGFRIVRNWKPVMEASTRPGFVDVSMLSADDGGSFDFEFDGRAVGIFCVCGPDSGPVRYSIDSEEPRDLNLRTRWSRTLYLPWLYVLADSLSDGWHTLHFEVPQGGGCHIRDFAVNRGCEPADYVNPFVGASTSIGKAGVLHGLGKTFPGATTPWGMVQVSPNTITGGDNGPGYSCEHETMEGFAFTQMSGIGWYGDFGNLLVMPTRGPMFTTSGLEDGSVRGWRSHFDKGSETACAGYYSAHLTDYGIRAESTAAPHGGMLRFTFPEAEDSRIQIDLARRVGGCSRRQFVEVVNDSTIRGWMYCPPECGGWGDGSGRADYTVYFYARFSRPMTDYGFWSAEIPEGWSRKNEDVCSVPYMEQVSRAEVIRSDRLEGDHIGFFTQFPTRDGETVTMQAGISYVDMAGAETNFKAELEGVSFGELRSRARGLWNSALDRITVSGAGDEDRFVFYTSLYHTMIDPRIFSDADGRYRGGDGSIHEPANGFTKRTIFSGWDVFRSQMPLMTLIYPDKVKDLVNSLVTLAEESGREYLERWEIVNAYSGCMVGNPAISVIADAYAKGIRDFDVEKAYRYCVNTSAMGIDTALGYIPDDISCTLEYAYDDWCLSRFARMTGHTSDVEFYERKSQSYRNIFDPEVGWFRPRLKDGTWVAWPENGRIEDDFGTVESNPYQQGWFVPHDVDGLAELLGGREAALSDLESFFDRTPSDFRWNSWYNHANEPVHWVPFLFNRLGRPSKTQEWTRRICTGAYHNSTENGLCGNEDCGQMSAWYVLSSIGIHPACPVDNTYEVTSPVFDRVELRLASGKTFTVIAHGNSRENVYIGRASLDGKPLGKMQLNYSDIAGGSTLELWMTSEVVF